MQPGSGHPQARAKTSAGSGAHRYYTRLQGQCWGPFSTHKNGVYRGTEGSVGLTQNPGPSWHPSHPSAVHQPQTSTSRLFLNSHGSDPRALLQPGTCVLYLPLRPVPSDPATHPSSLLANAAEDRGWKVAHFKTGQWPLDWGQVLQALPMPTLSTVF